MTKEGDDPKNDPLHEDMIRHARKIAPGHWSNSDIDCLLCQLDAARGALAASPAQALAEALREFRAAFANRGETTSLHEWHGRLKAADQRALETLAAWDAAQGKSDG